jgi:hypothetical protein
MNAAELDELYTKLCHALTAAGEAKTPMVLARLTLLLMESAASASVVDKAIDEAIDGMLP